MERYIYFLLVTTACTGTPPKIDTGTPIEDNTTDSDIAVDNDGDGYDTTEDCDDEDPQLTPADQDGDGFSSCDGDCNDSDALIHPQQTESCNDIDDNCNTEVDENATDMLSWYADTDGDGNGDPNAMVESCKPVEGYIEDSSDCDDSDASLNGQDNDGDGYSSCDGDCSDENPDLYPVDLDADGQTPCEGDCDDSDPWAYQGVAIYEDVIACMVDADEDGYGDSAPNNSAVNPGTDCDDSSALRNPGATESIGDGLDNDCDMVIDELIPIAIGISVQGIWDEANDTMPNPFLYPNVNNPNGSPITYQPYAEISLASMDFFTNGNQQEVCTMTAQFNDISTSAFDVEEFNYSSGSGSTGINVDAWGHFEGRLDIMSATYSDRCSYLDPDIFSNSDPLPLLDGMRLGIAYGPLSSALAGVYSAIPEWTANPNSFIGQYVAINHPDSNSASGYSFTAYDWNVGFFFGADADTCDAGVCGIVSVNEAMTEYIWEDATQEPRYGFVSGSPYWYQDFVNLDLSLLKEGAP